MGLIVLASLSPVRSKHLLSYKILPKRVANATRSGVSKASKVIAVKVLNDTGYAP